MIYALFDIDETLLSVKKGLDDEASKIMFKKVFNIDAYETLVETHGKTEDGIISGVLEKVGKTLEKVPEEAYKVWGETLGEMLEKNPVKVMPGISEMLTTLSSNNYIRLSLLTGNSIWRAVPKIKSANMNSFFFDIAENKLRGIFGDQSKIRADLLKIFRSWIKPEDKIIVIDDSLEGSRMSKAQSIPVISVATGKTKEEDFKPYSVNIFQDFAEDRWKKAVSIIESI